MPQFVILCRGKDPVRIEAANWIVAMGLGINALRGSTDIERLACEKLPNGTILARDIKTGEGYVIRQELMSFPLAPPEDRTVLDDDNDALISDSASEHGLFVDEPPPPPAIGAAQRDEDEVEELVRRIEAIADAPTAVIAWERALRVARRVAPCEAATAVQVTANDELFFVAVEGPLATELLAARIPFGVGFIGYCIQQAKPILVPDALLDPRHYKEMDRLLGFRTRAVICAPVQSEGLLFGALELINSTQGNVFDRAQLDKILLMSSVLGDRLYRAGLRGRRRVTPPHTTTT